MEHRELFTGQFIKFGKNRTRTALARRDALVRRGLVYKLRTAADVALEHRLFRPIIVIVVPAVRRVAAVVLHAMLHFAWHDFAYRIRSDSEIEIIEEFRGETAWDDWYSADGGTGDVIERRAVQLSAIPSRLQELYDRLNAGEKLSKSEEAEVASFTGNYARPAVGGYPIVDVINQLGGRSFLCQRLDDPGCPGCRRAGSERQTMYFLASLTNDSETGVRITFDEVQIVFFLCPTCGTIKVLHSV